MSENKNNNKSLFLYTSLIFIVAVLLIILSFFGQTNLKKSQPEINETTEETQQSGISERASVLSEENKTLLEENTQLKSEKKELEEKQTENDLLLAANGYFQAGDNAKALELLLTVNYENLTSDQKIIYDNVKNGLDSAEK